MTWIGYRAAALAVGLATCLGTVFLAEVFWPDGNGERLGVVAQVLAELYLFALAYVLGIWGMFELWALSKKRRKERR